MRTNIEHEGITDSIAGWARRSNMKPATLIRRLRVGMSFPEAISMPVRKPNISECVICGEEFQAPPTGKKTCSGRCSSRLKSRKRKRHGESGTRLHSIWCGMKSRCNSSTDEGLRKYYKHVTLDPSWEEYEVFRDWANANGYQVHLEIDRIENSQGYSPDNCRWATRHQQMCNTRKRSDAKTSKYRGVSKDSKSKSWRAQGHHNSKPFNIGSFKTEVEAAEAYDAWAALHYGEFASLNFTAETHGGVLY